MLSEALPIIHDRSSEFYFFFHHPLQRRTFFSVCDYFDLLFAVVLLSAPIVFLLSSPLDTDLWTLPLFLFEVALHEESPSTTISPELEEQAPLWQSLFTPPGR